MITVEETDPRQPETCDSCSIVVVARFEIQIKKTPDAQQATQFLLCLSCLEKLREKIAEIIPF